MEYLQLFVLFYLSWAAQSRERTIIFHNFWLGYILYKYLTPVKSNWKQYNVGIYRQLYSAWLFYHRNERVIRKKTIKLYRSLFFSFIFSIFYLYFFIFFISFLFLLKSFAATSRSFHAQTPPCSSPCYSHGWLFHYVRLIAHCPE